MGIFKNMGKLGLKEKMIKSGVLIEGEFKTIKEISKISSYSYHHTRKVLGEMADEKSVRRGLIGYPVLKQIKYYAAIDGMDVENPHKDENGEFAYLIKQDGKVILDPTRNYNLVKRC